MTYSSTLELHGLQMGFLEGRRLVVTYVYPGTIEVEGAGGVRYSPGKDEAVVELGRFDHADGAWFDDNRWSWNDATANPSARVWVQNVLAAHEAKKSRSYTHGGELVLVWNQLPTRRSEQALLAAGFQPSLATWRAATSERRRALVHALLANEATPVVSLPREATDERRELKERAQHAWMRWFAVFRDTLVNRTFRLKGTPALRDHELILNYRHSSGASLQVRLGVSRHPLLYPVTVDGAVTLQRDLVAWEDFPALEGEIGAVLDARKKAQRTSASQKTAPAKKASGRAKKPAEPVRPRDLAALPPAVPTPPTWTDRLVDAFNADAGPQLAFSRRRGQDTFVFVVHAEERPDHRLAVVDIQDEQLNDVRWLDDSLTPAEQDAIAARIERALARLDPDTEHATSLTRTALKKFKARAIALGADPERAAGSEEYRWLAEALRDLAAPRGTDLDDLAAWLSTRSLRGAAQLLREWTSEAPLENLFHDLWDNLETSITLSLVDEQDRRGFLVHPQTIAETDQGPALVLREMDADGRPRVVPVRLREDCEDDRCLIESEELSGGERAWHLGIEWDHTFILDLYKRVREFEHNIWTAPEQLAEVRELLYWAAAMIDTPRCRGESRRVAEAAFRDAKDHYDRARNLITQGDSPAGVAAMNAALRKIAEAAGELAESCAEGQTTLVGTPGALHGELRVEMRAPRMFRSPIHRPSTRRPRRIVTASASPPAPHPRHDTRQPARKPEGQPWWRVAPTIPRHQETEALHAEAAAIVAGVRAYLSDPDWSTLDDDERAEIIRESVVPLWEEDDAERLIQAVADVDGNLRDEDSIVEEIAAALRDSTDPELEIHTVTPDEACAFVRDHHRHLPECNRRGIVHALAARWRGQIAAVAVAGAPTGRWGRASDCPPEGTLEITRVASIAGLRRYDRRGRRVPVGAASALVARLVDLLPQSGRGLPGCRLVTYQLTSEDGAIYRALVAKGLRPVARSSHQQAGGARSHVALAGAKIRWEAGPAAGPPDWSLLQPQHRPGAQAAFGAFERIHQKEAA